MEGKIVLIENDDLNVMYIDGIKGGPIVTGKSKKEVKKNFLNAFCLGLVTTGVDCFVENKIRQEDQLRKVETKSREAQEEVLAY